MTHLEEPTDGRQDQGDEALDDDLNPPPRRRLPVLTSVLALAAVAGGAFLAGVLVQKHHDRSLVHVYRPTVTLTTGQSLAD